MVFFTLWFLFLSVTTPAPPVEPSVSVPEIAWPEETLNRKDVPPPTNNQLHVFRVRLFPYNSTQTKEGLWKLSRDAFLSLSNVSGQSLQTLTLSLYDVSEIFILSWRINRISNTWHEFVPHRIRIITWKGQTNEGEGDWRWLWYLPLETENSRWTNFSLFYDSWEKGVGDRLRWKHAQFPHFNYHFTTPLPGTIIHIQFLYP
ncbi:hypothetical protein [Thermospira aquatica]|uniref:Uncharacterized protein n=1 Tax=Thermospira aquatica TaxID=2828656 RepID=A0AAX3BEK1_9SPIR|nr:hypothetical protein [Thermospira aquatica]URA10670.1 hypothetical protein KDW03_02375 [Thermospira aquatica]